MRCGRSWPFFIYFVSPVGRHWPREFLLAKALQGPVWDLGTQDSRPRGHVCVGSSTPRPLLLLLGCLCLEAQRRLILNGSRGSWWGPRVGLGPRRRLGLRVGPRAGLLGVPWPLVPGVPPASTSTGCPSPSWTWPKLRACMVLFRPIQRLNGPGSAGALREKPRPRSCGHSKAIKPPCPPLCRQADLVRPTPFHSIPFLLLLLLLLAKAG